MTIQLPEGTAEIFTSIRNGAGFVNPLTIQIADLSARANSLKTISDGFAIASLGTTLENNIDQLSVFQTHTDTVSGVQEPSLDNEFGFDVRLNVINSVSIITDNNLDPTDSETVNDKVNKIYGSILSSGPFELDALDNSLTSLENESSSIALLTAEALEQEPIIQGIDANIGIIIQLENDGVREELQRITDLGKSMSLSLNAAKPEFAILFNKVLSQELKDIVDI